MKPYPVYNREGKTLAPVTLPEGLFGVRVLPALIQEAVVAQRAAARHPLAHTKRREEVRGGGRKPATKAASPAAPT